MKRFKISLIMVFLLNIAIINAQQTPKTLGYVKMSFLKFTNSDSGQFKNPGVFAMYQDSSKVKFTPNYITSTYYTEHLGVMCKEELKLEKAIKFPVKIRLGSKDQVDYLEGKYYSH